MKTQDIERRLVAVSSITLATVGEWDFHIAFDP